MSYLIDTHILLWWCLDQPELPQKYLKLLEGMEAKGEAVALSIISLWEISKLVSAGKFEISFSLDEWFEDLENDPALNILPLNSRIILEGNRLGQNFHKDPADQLIAATARCHSMRLLTVDSRIIKSGVVAIA